MSSRNYLDSLLQQLLKGKHSNYSEQYMDQFLEEDQFLAQDLPNIKNKWDERIKCTLISHKINRQNRDSRVKPNSKCIVYLHGFGSIRLESLHILRSIPLSYCLCMFDMTGCGKSEGEFNTYGIKESEDIQPVVTFLKNNKNMESFVLWGRSMGAVATLLYAIQKHSIPQNELFYKNRFMNNSLELASHINGQPKKGSFVKAIVIDSPFHNFRDIAKSIAIKRISIPDFLLNAALNYSEESFSKILSSSLGEQYNPFQINFDKEINLTFPTIILYSQKDEVVPPFHSERIIKKIYSKFERILISSCNHNEPRPEHVIKSIFEKLDKYCRAHQHEIKKKILSLQRQTIENECIGKRGIFVFSSSKQKQYHCELMQYKSMELKPKSHIVHSKKYKQDIFLQDTKSKPPSLRQSKITFQNSIISPKMREVVISNLNTQSANLINNKLTNFKEREVTPIRLLRSKRWNASNKNQQRLTSNK